MGHISCLFFLGIIPFIFGVIFAYYKRKDSLGTIYKSHFYHLTKTFWVYLLICLSIIFFVLVFFLQDFYSTSRSMSPGLYLSGLLLLYSLQFGFYTELSEAGFFFLTKKKFLNNNFFRIKHNRANIL